MGLGGTTALLDAAVTTGLDLTGAEKARSRREIRSSLLTLGAQEQSGAYAASS